MKIITRFAPSPTGFLHIGGARTALFNFLFAKNKGGDFLLRIEDTDKLRSEEKYEKQIIKTLNWLGLEFQNNFVKQSKNINQHIMIANELLKKGFAYKCYCTDEEINKQKEICKKRGTPYIYNRKWRDPKDLKIPDDVDPVLRFKSKISGNTIIKDIVQGDKNIANSTIEDFIILRKDKSPTYQLSATVDDHEMKITHIIRGDDHMINSFKQKQIYDAMGWEIPQFAHVPLIHSKDGRKLSKRDGSSNIEEYIKNGYLPDAMRNYLLRLGWSYKDKEIFSMEESIKLFNLENIGKSPSKLDIDRIHSINVEYIKSLSDDDLFYQFSEYLNNYERNFELSSNILDQIKQSIHFLKNNTVSLKNIYLNAEYIFNYSKISKNFKFNPSEKEKEIIDSFVAKISKKNIIDIETLKKNIDEVIKENKIKFKEFGKPIRLCLICSERGPGITDIIKSLGIKETVRRLKLFT
ncbi:MAG: glutamate--tRNA ligase [Candidatus Pelagibacter sp.]|nr:glutamate--tRNA ligase [Candidatus Pelagibacter sp.]OUV98761.1 MAG: glutamate--tRNA ligase [Candidatus Pelagibacter sp. TMED142]|tara:strand:- start:1080 stop:2474 length:1395 start_codon:yes stop_codon:yes gene_type:complete